MRDVTAEFEALRRHGMAGFDIDVSRVDRAHIGRLADLWFTEAGHDAVFIGAPGTGQAHLPAGIGVTGAARHGTGARERARWARPAPGDDPV
jgi:DNA replication protein DnaC